MPNDEQITMRLPSEFLARADALAPVLAELPEFATWRVSRAAVIRLALAKGLTTLERSYPPGDARRTTKR